MRSGQVFQQAASLRGEARVVNHSSCARVLTGPEFANKLEENLVKPQSLR